MNDYWKLQLSLSFWLVAAWITWHPYCWRKALQLSKLKVHMMTERAKQLKPYRGKKSFNLFILLRDNWCCYLCHKPIPYGQAQVEHDIPVSKFGYTNESNCHASDASCNNAKGTMTAQEYWRKKRKSSS